MTTNPTDGESSNGTPGDETSGPAAAGAGGTGDGGTPTSATPYALTFNVDYPDRDLDKLSSGLRFLWVIPILVVLGGLGGYSTSWSFSSSGFFTLASGGAGVIFIAPALMILFRQKYPRWWWDFNVQLLKFQARVGMYAALATDAYPSTDEEQSVHLEVGYPDVEKLNRWLPIVKWLLAIPHYVVLFFLYIAAFFVLIYAWVMILVNARYPRGAFDFIVGVNRWSYRVEAYALLLATDEYPPFSLD